MMELGDHRLDLDAQVLRDRDGAVVLLRPQAWAVLCLLAANAGRVVTKDQMLEAVWPGRIVTDASLAQAVSDVRSALGAAGRELVKTVARRGYMLAGPAACGRQVLAPLSVPAAADDLIGRDDALDELGAALAGDRLVSVLGSGGIGKTRLAQALALRSAAHYPDGIAWVDLTPISRADELGPAVVAAVRLAHLGGGAEELARAAGGLSALLVLDNCEHLIESVAHLARSLLTGGSRLRVLVTSQAPLRIDGERVYRLRPLEIPEADAPSSQALAVGAVALFVRQARATDSRFGVDDLNVAAVVELCRHLDGNPLAIKLAAARAPVLGLAMLGARIAERLQMLVGGGRDAPVRQQTLAATLAWSYQLLDADEQRVFRALGVFAGSFTIEAAVAVADAGGGRDWPLIDLVTRLVDRSLVDVDSHARLRMSESARVFALDRLTASGEAVSAARRHAQACAALFARLADDLYGGRISQRAYVNAVRLDADNLRAAMRWLLGEDGNALLALSLLADAAPFCHGLAIQDEAVRWLTDLGRALDGRAGAREAARYRCAAIHWTYSWTGSTPPRHVGSNLPFGQAPLDALEDAGRQGHALCVLANELIFGRSRSAAQVALAQAAALESTQWPPWLRLVRLNCWAVLELLTSPDAVERELSGALVNLLPAAGADSGAAFTLHYYRALNSWLQGRFAEAADRFEAIAQSGWRDQRDCHDMCWVRLYLAIARFEQGRLDEARARALESLPVLRRAGVLGLATNGLALLAAKLGLIESAAKLFGASEAFLVRTGWRHNRIGERIIAEARVLIGIEAGNPAVNAWIDEGRRFDDDAIVHEMQMAIQPTAAARREAPTD